MSVREDIYQHLEALEIPYRKIEHEAVRTSQEAAEVRGSDLHAGAKALLVKNKENFVIFVIPADEILDWKVAKKLLANKKLRFATPEEMLETTGLVKGSLPPFGNLLGLPVYMDEELAKESKVAFNVGSLTNSIEMKGADLPQATEAILGNFGMHRN